MKYLQFAFQNGGKFCSNETTDEYSEIDSFTLEPFMRPVKINERLLTVICMGVGTLVHRRCSRELLVAVQLGNAL